MCFSIFIIIIIIFSISLFPLPLSVTLYEYYIVEIDEKLLSGMEQHTFGILLCQWANTIDVYNTNKISSGSCLLWCLITCGEKRALNIAIKFVSFLATPSSAHCTKPNGHILDNEKCAPQKPIKIRLFLKRLKFENIFNWINRLNKKIVYSD